MAKQSTTAKVSRDGRKTTVVRKDNSVMTGRQQLRAKKLEYKQKTQQTRARTAAVKALSMNIGQAITGATGSIVSGQTQSEQTKRAVLSAKSNAAQQATQGGLSDSTNTRDDDDKDNSKEVNPWVY